MLAVVAMLARLYLVKNWHQIRQTLPGAGAGAGAGAELVGAGRAGADRPMLARRYLVKNWYQIRRALPGAGAELVVLPMAGRAGRC